MLNVLSPYIFLQRSAKDPLMNKEKSFKYFLMKITPLGLEISGRSKNGWFWMQIDTLELKDKEKQHIC